MGNEIAVVRVGDIKYEDFSPLSNFVKFETWSLLVSTFEMEHYSFYNVSVSAYMMIQ